MAYTEAEHRRIKLKAKSFFLTTALILFRFAASPAQANTLYNNDFGGVVSGDAFDENSWNINSFGVTDSFSLATNSKVTSFTVALWMDPGDTLASLKWYFTTAEFGGATLDSGSGAATTETLLTTNGDGFLVYSEAFNIGPGVALTAGTTYWLQLDTATSTTLADPVYWDQSDGPSSGYQTTIGKLPDGHQCNGLCTGSESFELFGNVPEPGTIAVLGAGLAIVGLIRVYRRSSAA